MLVCAQVSQIKARTGKLNGKETLRARSRIEREKRELSNKKSSFAQRARDIHPHAIDFSMSSRSKRWKRARVSSSFFSFFCAKIEDDLESDRQTCEACARRNDSSTHSYSTVVTSCSCEVWRRHTVSCRGDIHHPADRFLRDNVRRSCRRTLHLSSYAGADSRGMYKRPRRRREIV